MRSRTEMSLVFDRSFSRETRGRDASLDGETSRLSIAVVYTSRAATVTALKRASILARRLDAQLTLVVPQVVPYPLPLTEPQVAVAFSESRLGEIAAESPLPAAVRLYLCRDRVETLKGVLAPSSVVVIGGRRRWWPNPEKDLARQLRRVGLEVVFTEQE